MFNIGDKVKISSDTISYLNVPFKKDTKGIVKDTYPSNIADGWTSVCIDSRGDSHTFLIWTKDLELDVEVNYWDGAYIKLLDDVHWYISSKDNNRAFNPLTKEWVNSLTNEDGVLVCAFQWKLKAERCFEKNKPKPKTLIQAPIGAKFKFDGYVLIKTNYSQNGRVLCVEENRPHLTVSMREDFIPELVS